MKENSMIQKVKTEGHLFLKASIFWGTIFFLYIFIVNSEVFANEIYEEIGLYTDGLARVKRDGKYGYIDKQGKEVISCKYDIAPESFEDGMALVRIYRKGWGVILKTGKELVTLGKYDEIFLPYINGMLRVKKNGKYGFVDSKDRERVKCRFDDADESFRYGGVTRIWIGDKVGVVNNKGKIVVKPGRYTHIMEFNNGYARASINSNPYFIQEEGIINHKGKEIIKPRRYFRVNDISDGMFKVVNDSQMVGFVNKKGKEVIPCIYESATDFENGTAVVSNVFNYIRKKGLINKKGREIVKVGTYDEINSFKNGLAYVEASKREGFINRKGREVIPLGKYNWSFNFFTEGMLRVKRNDEYGVVNEKGEEIIPLGMYSYINEEYRGGVIRVERDGLYGFVDKEGIEIVPCQYDKIDEGLYNGFAHVHKDGMIGMVNSQGNIIIPLGRYSSIDDFEDGIVLARKDGKRIAIDTGGNEVASEFEYDEIGKIYKNGLLKVGRKLNKEKEYYSPDNYKFGFVDKNGIEVIPCEYDEALYYEGNPDYWGEEIYEDSFDSFTYYYFKDGIATLRKGDTWYVVDTLGNIIRSFQ